MDMEDALHNMGEEIKNLKKDKARLDWLLNQGYVKDHLAFFTSRAEIDKSMKQAQASSK